MATGTLLINIDGQGNASNLSYEKTLDSLSLGKGKIEHTIYFSVTEATESITFSNNGTLSTLLVQSSSTTESIDMTLHIDNGVDPAYTIVIPFIEFGVWNFGSTFFSYITSIDFTTSSSSYLEINVRAYA